jgi:hypothetical protein
MNTQRRRIALLAVTALLVCLTEAALSEVGVQIRTEHVKLHRLEPVLAFVTVENSEWEPLVLASPPKPGAASLAFTARTEGGEAVAVLGEAPEVDITVPPEETRVVMVPLSSHFDFRDVGGYLIEASIEVDGVRYQSHPVQIDVVTGLPLKALTRAGPDGKPRHYQLSYLSREQHETLFLSVDEPSSGLNYGVFALGSLVRVFAPHVEVNPVGTITVVYQCDARQYARAILWTTASGVRLVDQTYERLSGHVDANGKWTMPPTIPEAGGGNAPAPGDKRRDTGKQP